MSSSAIVSSTTVILVWRPHDIGIAAQSKAISSNILNRIGCLGLMLPHRHDLTWATTTFVEVTCLDGGLHCETTAQPSPSLGVCSESDGKGMRSSVSNGAVSITASQVFLKSDLISARLFILSNHVATRAMETRGKDQVSRNYLH